MSHGPYVNLKLTTIRNNWFSIREDKLYFRWKTAIAYYQKLELRKHLFFLDNNSPFSILFIHSFLSLDIRKLVAATQKELKLIEHCYFFFTENENKENQNHVNVVGNCWNPLAFPEMTTQLRNFQYCLGVCRNFRHFRKWFFPIQNFNLLCSYTFRPTKNYKSFAFKIISDSLKPIWLFV